MLRRLRSLHDRYAVAHLSHDQIGGPICDVEGGMVGAVERITVGGGRLRVVGWALAEEVRLVHGATEAAMAPRQSRPDLAGAIETVGFDLSVPARIGDVAHGRRPGLVVMRAAGAAPVAPQSLAVGVPRRVRLRTLIAFARDMALSVPAVVGWAVRGDPVYRARVKRRLGLGLVTPGGLLEAGLLCPADDASGPGATGDVAAGRVTIVLPAYNAFDLLRDCLARIEARTDLPWRLIAIEDGSTDARVRPYLRDWAEGRDRVELLENDGNKGFIASVNRGLARALEAGGPEEGPVVLLNSDALVPDGWASRLVAPFRGRPEIATVTPMSNDAEIFSVPRICARTMLEPGQGDAIDRVARRIREGAGLADAPTGVGFCMAMSRDWLAREPRLDPAFGRGYGEEVDWCRKVAARGGRHLALPGLFVEHRGGESFGSTEKRTLVAKNNRIVSGRYPTYDREVQDFIAADPLRTPRLVLGLAWAGSLPGVAPVPVYLAHSTGGGADLWLEHRMAEDLAVGRPSVVLRVGGARRFQVELVAPAGCTIGETDAAEVVRELLDVLPRRRIVYSCGVGDPDPLEIPELLVSLLREGDVAEMLFHDFYPLSPSYTLLDRDGIYRGPLAEPRDDPAHLARRPDGRSVPLTAWQEAWKAFATRADLTVFSRDSAAQVTAVWPDVADRIRLRPHRLLHDVPRLAVPPLAAPRVVAVLGNIGAQKGAGVVQALARHLAREGEDAPRLIVIGNVDPAFALPSGVLVHGSYAVRDIEGLAARYGVTHWLIPSIWPETFCYTAHEALRTGLPVIAFDLGAQGAAVAAAANGIALPFRPGADAVPDIVEAIAGRGPASEGDGEADG